MDEIKIDGNECMKQEIQNIKDKGNYILSTVIVGEDKMPVCGLESFGLSTGSMMIGNIIGLMTLLKQIQKEEPELYKIATSCCKVDQCISINKHGDAEIKKFSKGKGVNDI